MVEELKYVIWSQTLRGISYLRPIRSSASTEGALEEARRAEQHIITMLVEAAPNQLKRCGGA